jgi:L,D-transpeptidase YcbB
VRKFFLIAMCFLFTAYADDLPATNQMLLDKMQGYRPIQCAVGLKCASPYLAKFYQNRGYSLAWIKDGRLTSAGEGLVKAIDTAYIDGLDPRAYHVGQIDAMVAALKANKTDANLLTNLDVTLSDGLLLYLNNLVNGFQNGKRLYPSWPIAKKSVNLAEVAEQITQTDDVNKALAAAGPKFPGYAKLREKLADYYAIARQGGWAVITEGDNLQIGSKGDRVSLLQKRLYVSGELAEIDNDAEFDSDVKKAVIKYQQNNGLNDDGIVDKLTLNSLNVPVTKRIRQIELNMDRMRFLPDIYPSRYVMVNIPGYSLEAYQDGKMKLYSDVVVGKPNKKTCVLNSQIATMELNPYWNIPVSIVKEILPDIKADPNYLADNGIKVFRVGDDGQYNQVDPKSIDWKSNDPSILNLRFREDPGEDNALGRYKFIFSNSCGIYLHDSLAQSAFDESSRGLSHGCIRISEVDDFANFLIATNSGWDSSRLKTELDSNKHQFVKYSKPTQLYIIYLTAWYDDEEDFVQFRDDIYHYDKLSLYPLYLLNTQG